MITVSPNMNTPFYGEISSPKQKKEAEASSHEKIEMKK